MRCIHALRWSAIASPSNAERVAKERKIPHAFPSTEAMLAGVELDVVSVASPPFDHLPSVLAALAAGKHVLCEKPFGMNVAEAEQMVAAAERAGTATAMSFEFRYVPAIIALRELLDNGHIGALREIDVSRMGRDLLERQTNRSQSWWFSREKGGGIANAFMPHFFDLANQLAGRPPVATHGFLRTANPRRVGPDGPFESTVADGAFAWVDYGDGIAGRVSNDSTTVIESLTDRRPRRSPQRGREPDRPSPTSPSYAITEDEEDELEIAKSEYDKYAVIAPNIPWFVRAARRLRAPHRPRRERRPNLRRRPRGTKATRSHRLRTKAPKRLLASALRVRGGDRFAHVQAARAHA